jgi:hypothetical protein
LTLFPAYPENKFLDQFLGLLLRNYLKARLRASGRGGLIGVKIRVLQSLASDFLRIASEL